MDYRDHNIYSPANRGEVIYTCKAHHSNHDIIGEPREGGGEVMGDYGYKSMPLRTRTLGHGPRCAHCEDFLREGGACDDALPPEVFYPHEVACNIHNERIYVPVRSPTSARYAMRLDQQIENNLDRENTADPESKKYEKPSSPDVIGVPRTPKIANTMNNRRPILRNNSCDDNLESSKSGNKAERTPVPRHVTINNSMGTL